MSQNKKDQLWPRRYLSSIERKEEILDAALLEFSNKTYSAVSMERLAVCAKLSKAGIYAHFKSKEDILQAVLDRASQQAETMQGWLPDEDLSLPKLVDVYIERLYLTFQSPLFQATYRLALTESTRAPELIKNWHQDIHLRLENRANIIIQRYIERGVIRKSVLTEHFFPLALAPALLWLNSAMLAKDTASIERSKVQDIHRQLLLELLSPHAPKQDG